MPEPRRWSYWHRPDGGSWVWDEHDTGTVIGYVTAGDDIADGWVAHPTWAGGLDPIVGPFTSRPAAARSMFDAWQAAPDIHAPEVPAP